jgi:3-hydroxyisobutyrate dehydrogenase-like beta-hydroxyacid dehydrogenase
MDRVGVVGLGIMGMAYARNLIAAGHSVIGYDVISDPMTALAELGGSPAGSSADVARASDVVLLALPNVAALRQAVAASGGVVEGAGQGLVVVEMGTFPLEYKKWAQTELESAGAVLVDAPVSGTGLQAEAGEVVVYASGDPAAIERTRPVFDALGKATYDVGEFGNGSKMKYVANLLVSVNNLATAEAFVLGAAAGLDPAQILEVISAGVGSSRIFEIRGPMMVADDYPPAARLSMFLKDIDVIGGFARDLGVPTPMLDAALPWYQKGVEAGLGDLDAAALARLLAGRETP